jgi:hypothetical protein
MGDVIYFPVKKSTAADLLQKVRGARPAFWRQDRLHTGFDAMALQTCESCTHSRDRDGFGCQLLCKMHDKAVDWTHWCDQWEGD